MMHDLSLRRAAIGIALVSLATLAFELLVNKALAVSLFGSLGYMVIGSAIFGYSIAGVVIAIWQPQHKYRLSHLLTWAALVFTLSIVLCYLVMNLVPLNFEELRNQWLPQVIAFTIWYLALLIPFTASGFMIVLLLLAFKQQSNRLYAADLLGAGVGSILVLPLFPLIGAAGQYFVCAALGAALILIVARRRQSRVGWLAGGLLVVFLALAPVAERVYPVMTHQDKRDRGAHYKAGYITHSLWSFLSKIEVAQPPNQDWGAIWFDAGFMQSALDRFDGDYQAARQSQSVSGANSLAYRIQPVKHALIIAPAGGRELRAALTWGAERVTGVELDYSVVRLVKEELNEYLGGIFNDPRVTLVNDEGRSFTRRSTDKYDVIQFISAYSAPAVQSGAVDLASSYLMTVEAFDDYLDHLTPTGVLSISKDYNLRLFTTAWQALERRGLDPRPRLVLVRNDGSTLGRNTVLVKMSPFSPQELAVIRDVSQAQGIAINYAPPALMAEVDAGRGLVSEPQTRRLIEDFVNTPLASRAAFYARFPYKIFPVTDDRPFFDDINYLFQDVTAWPELLTEEVAENASKATYFRYITMGAIPYLFVLLEAALFGILFLIFPLWRFKSEGIRTPSQQLALLYFLALGFGFIWIEIVLLKTFILFLGNPVYSISLVLCVMLIAAGIGSFLSERLRGRLSGSLLLVALALTVMVGIVIWVYPALLRHFLTLTFPLRLVIGAAFIVPVGLVLGLPFPLGLKHLSATSPETIPWAWAMNGYATVIGVATSAFAASWAGFSSMLACSLIVYLVGFLGLYAGMVYQTRQAQPARPAVPTPRLSSGR